VGHAWYIKRLEQRSRSRYEQLRAGSPDQHLWYAEFVASIKCLAPVNATSTILASVVTPKFINHLRPSFTFLPRWNISP